jgi:hypothetical protein
MISKSARSEPDHAFAMAFPAMDGFLTTVDNARFDELRDAQRDHLGMETEVVFSIEDP